MIQITALGTAGRDAEPKNTPQHRLTKFSISVSAGKNPDGSWKDSTWISCAAWGKQADDALRDVVKGAKVLVIGRAALRSYQAKDGTTKTELEVNVSELKVVGAPGQGGGSNGNGYKRGRSAGDSGDAGDGGFGDDADVPFLCNQLDHTTRRPSAGVA